MTRKILLIDDDPDQLAVLKFLLQKHKFQVVPAASAEAALPVLTATPFDAVVCDMKMPVLNGGDFCSLIRNAGAGEHNINIPFVLLTASAEEASESQRERGITVICAKGDAQQHLVSTLQKALSPS